MRPLRQQVAARALGVLAAACLWLPVSPRAQSRPPNIVFILADDLGVNDLGSYGRGKGEYDLTREAERFIDANHERPFFLHLAHNNPHIPYAASQKLVEANPAAFEPVYAATVQTLDDSVGRVLSHLDRSGLRERTIVIFTSDNGGLHMPEGPHPRVTHNTPFRAGKGYLYEGGLRVPLIVDGPGLAKNRVVDTPLINTDWLPTLLELAGVRASGEIDGISQAKLLKSGRPSPGRRTRQTLPSIQRCSTGFTWTSIRRVSIRCGQTRRRGKRWRSGASG